MKEIDRLRNSGLTGSSVDSVFTETPGQAGSTAPPGITLLVAGMGMAKPPFY